MADSRSAKSFPLYLEGTIALSRYDPTFVATDGAERRLLPVKWDTASTTIGIGWDFPITDELRFRPILNGTIGRVTSDLRVAQAVINRAADTNLQFLDDGALNAYGYGGSDASPYRLIEQRIVVNGGKPYQTGKLISAYFGRFHVVQNLVAE